MILKADKDNRWRIQRRKIENQLPARKSVCTDRTRDIEFNMSAVGFSTFRIPHSLQHTRFLMYQSRGCEMRKTEQD